MRVRIHESYPGEMNEPGAQGRAHDALVKALRKAVPRGAEWDVVEEIARTMQADYQDRMDRMVEQIGGLV